ncbi:MAG: LysM peptidoglycan-binding domain-containing protein [Bacilli bacterium]|nr:LysM peptidoglycan-binding domain-containing protein [Bacilli bacterium]
MNGKKIVIDAGHGGSDPGATGNIIEKEYNLKIANYIYNRLKEFGVPVAITRTTDEYISPNDRVKRILNAFGNNNDVIVLSNHLNAGGGTGAEVVYALRNNDTLSKLILEELSKEGQSIRKWYQRRLPSDPSKDYYFIHRNTGRTEPVLIEYGFVDNAKDANFIKNNWQDLAEATVRAILTYIGVPYDKVGENSIYVVKSGDSLYSIAKKFNVSVDSLKSANNLQNNLIRINQKLVIPGFTDNTNSNINYIVQRGDTLYSIASKYNTTINDIKTLNNLTSNILSIGQNLKIPAKKEEIIIDENMPISNYTVKVGDTISTIADNYNISVTDLINYNNLTDYELYVGQILKIPTIKENNNVYIVKRGDTLYSIARQFNTTIDNLKRLNNLDGNNLQIGQTLIIEEVPTNNTYIVKRGDTLYSIARELNTTVNELKRLNNLNSNIISINQELKY